MNYLSDTEDSAHTATASPFSSSVPRVQCRRAARRIVQSININQVFVMTQLAVFKPQNSFYMYIQCRRSWQN